MTLREALDDLRRLNPWQFLWYIVWVFPFKWGHFLTLHLFPFVVRNLGTATYLLKLKKNIAGNRRYAFSHVFWLLMLYFWECLMELLYSCLSRVLNSHVGHHGRSKDELMSHMDYHAWMRRCLLTSKDLDTSILCRQFSGPTRWLDQWWVEGIPCYQCDLMLFYLVAWLSDIF